MRFNSIKFKISILYVVVLGVILVIYSSILYWSLRYTLYSEMDEELTAKARGISNVITAYLDTTGYDKDAFLSSVRRAIKTDIGHPKEETIEKYEREWLQQIDKFDLREDYVIFLDKNGNSIVSSNNLPTGFPVSFFKAEKMLTDGSEAFMDLRFDKRNFRVITTTFRYKDNDWYVIQIATSLKPIITMLRKRLLHIMVSIPAVLLLASFVGQLFAVRILRPVMKITQTANKITHEDLRTRVEAKGVDEEMRFLVGAFNDMISRLERSFAYIAEFSSEVAHELKTPLAIIRGEAEVALRKERESSDYKKVIRVNLEEAERMVKTIDDLLLLSKLDNRPEIFKFERVEFIEFFKEIHEYTKILSSDKGISVDVVMPKESVIINADRLHLRRLFFNLINNAVKFTPKGGKIIIAFKCENKNAIVSISDTGIGIAEEDLPRVFDRFFHKPPPDEEPQTGSGLGLSIAQSIAKIHNGSIIAQSAIGRGSTFTVTLPY